MTTTARRRLLRDFKKISEDPTQGISATPQEDDLMKWDSVIFGPDESPWEGGIF